MENENNLRHHLISDILLEFRGKNSNELKVKLSNIVTTAGKFEIGFKSFTTYLTWHNVYEGRDTLVASKDNGSTWDIIKMPAGAYDLKDIKNYLDAELKSKGIDLKLIYNVNTFKGSVELTNTSKLDFSKSNLLTTIWGFKNRTDVVSIGKYTSENNINITDVSAIYITSNDIHGSSYSKDGQNNVLQVIPINALPGDPITLNKINVKYMELNEKNPQEIKYFAILQEKK